MMGSQGLRFGSGVAATENLSVTQTLHQTREGGIGAIANAVKMNMTSFRGER